MSARTSLLATKYVFMMMGRSSSLCMTNSAFKSTTSLHLTTRSRWTHHNRYFRQPAGLVWHNYKMRVVALKFIFEMTPLYGVVHLKLIFEPTVCRIKHFPNSIATVISSQLTFCEGKTEFAWVHTLKTNCRGCFRSFSNRMLFQFRKKYFIWKQLCLKIAILITTYINSCCEQGLRSTATNWKKT